MLTSVDEVSPAAMSTILLMVMLFMVNALVPGCKSELNGKTLFVTKLEGTLSHARHKVDIVPVLVTLSLETRMRDLQISPKHEAISARTSDVTLLA